MKRLIRKLPIFLIAVVLALFGCSVKSTFSSEEEYKSQRGTALMADLERSEYVNDKSGNKAWFVWQTESGTAILDKIKVDGQNITIEKSYPFGSLDEAKGYANDINTKEDPPELGIEKYRTDRSTELGGATGMFAGNTDGGHYYSWTKPDGTVVTDTVNGDRKGGVSVKKGDQMSEGEPPIELPVDGLNLADWKQKRGTELNASLDWGTDLGSFRVWGWKKSDGKYVADVIEPDTFKGIKLVKTMEFDSLQDMASAIGSQIESENAVWMSNLQWGKRGFMLIIPVLLIMVFVVINIRKAKSSKGVSIRRIAGLDQIDEAIGRATETARPVLMVPGIGVLDGISLQALAIFSSIVRTACRFATPIRLMTMSAPVYGVAQEMVRDVYLSEGVPEQFDPDSVQYVTDRQFAFASAVAGTIQREKVAATFLMGEFFAESLIFAENANVVGAIQVASSTQTTQTPFFVAACDYVLLGDEFYAASAYLGRQQVLLGSLAGIDWAKMMFMACALIGVIFHSLQTMKPIDMNSVSPEERAEYQKNNQTYYDWRTEVNFKQLVQEKRL